MARVMQITVGSRSGIWTGSAAASIHGSFAQGALHQKMQVSGPEQTVITLQQASVRTVLQRAMPEMQAGCLACLAKHGGWLRTQQPAGMQA